MFKLASTFAHYASRSYTFNQAGLPDEIESADDLDLVEIEQAIRRTVHSKSYDLEVKSSDERVFTSKGKSMTFPANIVVIGDGITITYYEKGAAADKFRVWS